MQKINFVNKSNLPIVVSSWTEQIRGRLEYIDITVPPNTEQIVNSSVGEWILGSLFSNSEYFEQWQNANLKFESRIAKFRNEPGIYNTYTWNFIENRFNLNYENGNIVWSDK